jgi:hypothetical protein
LRAKPFLLGVSLLILTALPAQAEVVQAGLIGYWNANNNANDSSPTANHGTFSGAYVPGVSGQAFDLSTGYVNVPDIPAYSFGDFSMGLWFMGGGSPPHSYLAQDVGGGDQPKWILNYNGQFNFHMNGAGGGSNVASNAVPVSAGWNQLTLTRAGNNYQFYLNGSNVGGAVSAAVFSDPAVDLVFGFAELNSQFNGLMDNVVLYNRALTPQEVQTLAATTPLPAALPLFATAVGLGGLISWRRKRRAVRPLSQIE